MLKYFLEIKNRLALLFSVWIFSFFSIYSYKETLLYNVTQINESYYLSSFYFIFTNLIEVFNVYVRLTIFFTNQFFILFVFYHLFYFISPALYKLEYKVLYKTFRYILLTWFFSIVFFTNVFVPITWTFFLSFEHFTLVSLHFEAKINEFLDFYISLYYLCVFYCTFFTILFFVLNSINKNVKFIKEFRKIYYYLFIIFSTMISPPDVLSQFVTSLVIVIAYEILVFISMLNFLKF